MKFIVQLGYSIGLLCLLFLISIVSKADDTNSAKIPFVFRENAGQWGKEILYKGNSSSANVLFTKSGMIVSHSRKTKTIQPGREDELEFLNWEISFKDANPNPKVLPLARASSYTNYLIGSSDQHRSNVPDYNELRYESIYNKIDLHYYSYNNELKYDFILSPGAEMSDIKLKLEGIKNIRLKANGDIELSHAWGTVIEKKPYSYQEVEGEKVEIDIRYELIDKKTFGYKVYGQYDPSKKIVIDPLTIAWGTYVGGTSPLVSGYQYDIAVGKGGETYGTGYYPQSFITTSGSYDRSYNGGYGDVFVYKLNASGSGLDYATYVGGSEDDRGMAIAVNSSGEAFVAGYTYSPYNSFPNTVKFGSTTSSSNAFVFKLNSSGSALIYSAYMGANDQESALDVAINSLGEAIIVGETKSYNFPMATTTYDNTYNGGANDGFFVKMNSAGTAMLSSGFLGGLKDDRAQGVAIDKNNNVYITGNTGSVNFPVSAGAYDNSYNGGFDVFVMKFNPTLTTPQYSTFIGGSFDEEGLAIDVSKDMEPVITGYSFSNNYPIKSPESSVYSGLKDIILTKLNPSGSSLDYSRLIGGAQNDIGTSLTIDDSNNVYLVGMTESNISGSIPKGLNEIAQDNRVSILNGEYNVYFGIFCKQGKTYQSGLIGGGKDDYNKPSIGLQSRRRVCNVIIGFTSHSDDLITTKGAYQERKLNGGTDNDQLAVYKIAIDLGKDSSKQHIINVCGPQTLSLCDRSTKSSYCDPPVMSVDCQSYSFPIPNIEVSTATISSNICHKLQIVNIYKYVDTSKAYIFGPSIICLGQSVELNALDKNGMKLFFAPHVGVKYVWSTGEKEEKIIISAPGTYWLKTSNACGFEFYDTIVIKAIDKPTVDLGPDRTICFPGTTTLVAVNANDTIPTTYLWTPTGQTSASITVNSPGQYCVAKTNKCGTANDCITINPAFAPIVNLGPDTSLCNGTPITLDAGNAGATYLWSPGGQTTQTITVNSVGTYSVIVTNSCGSASDQITVTLVTAPPIVNLGPNLLLCSPSDFPHLLDAGNPGSNYYWSTGSTNQTISITKGGQYFVTVTNGCGIDRDTISITAPPSLGLNLGPDTALCIPASLVLDAGNPGSGTFLWTPGGQTTQTKTVATSGTYSVTVTNACGTATDNIVVTIQNGLPVVNLGPNKSICQGTPTILNAGNAAGQTYQWSTGATSSSISVTTIGTYWVDVTNACGTVRDSIRLSDGLPSFSLGPDKYRCSPASILLSAAGAGSSYLWSTGALSASINVSTTAIYWVDVTNSCGTLRDSVFVSIAGAQPNVNLGVDQVQCSSFSSILDAGNPNSTYLWSPGGQTTSTITVNSAGIYSVVVTNGCGTDRDSVLITTQPMNPLGPDISICQGSSTLLDAGNVGATYLWTPNGETTQTISVSSAGNYGVTVTNACGSITDNIDVTILNAAPSVNLGPDIRVCLPASPILDAGNSGATYLWSTGATTQTIVISSTGKYYVTARNSCGVSTDTILVTLDNGVPVVDLGPDQDFCNPFFTMLDAGAGAASYSWSTGATTSFLNVINSGTYSVTVTNACGAASDNSTITGFNPVSISLKDTGSCINPITLLGGNAGSSYFWAPGGETTSSIVVNNSGSYTLTVNNACGIVSKTIKVIINTAVAPFSFGADTNLCAPSGLLLDAGIHIGATYLWSPGAQTTSSIQATQSGNYSVTVTNYCGMTTDNITISANPVAVNARFEDTICIGASIRLYTDSLSSYSYSWSPASLLINPLTPSPTATPLTTTTYVVTTSDGICFNTDSVIIHVEKPIDPDIDIFPPSGEGYVPLEIKFKDRNNIGVSYIWNFGDGTNTMSIAPTHSFTTENYFTIHVTAITENGCRAYDSIIVKAFTLFIPNLITPNGDGKNDSWDITDLHDKLYVQIYNRWGDRVYEQDNYIDQWTGEGLSDGVYYYLVEDRKFDKNYKGWVQLLRSE